MFELIYKLIWEIYKLAAERRMASGKRSLRELPNEFNLPRKKGPLKNRHHLVFHTATTMKDASHHLHTEKRCDEIYRRQDIQHSNIRISYCFTCDVEEVICGLLYTAARGRALPEQVIALQDCQYPFERIENFETRILRYMALFNRKAVCEAFACAANRKTMPFPKPIAQMISRMLLWPPHKKDDARIKRLAAPFCLSEQP